jgi:hypothetical protein
VDTKNKALMYAGENAVIPSDGSVEFISGNSFQGFPEVASIHIPKSVKRINYNAFRNCTGIESITCDDENEYFYVVNNCLIEKGTKKLFVGCNNSIIPNDGSVEIIGAYSFNNRRIKSDFSLPEGITVIEGSAFMDCTGIGGVDLPSTVTTIDDTAFQNSDIVSVSIPLGIKKLGSVFSGCKSLTTAVLPEGLEELDSTFGDCSSLVNVNIPSTVKILRGAFYGTAIKSISLPEGLQNLEMLTFASCTELESIELPKSLKFIGPAIFSDCTNLISIKYNGTVADWEKVDKYSGPLGYRFNDRLYEVAIKCTDGEVLTEKPEYNGVQY